MKFKRLVGAPTALLIVALAACAAPLVEPVADGTPTSARWPAAWQGESASAPGATAWQDTTASARAPAVGRSTSASSRWPAVWQDTAQGPAVDFRVPRFEAPSASHCQRAPTTREVPGGSRTQDESPPWHSRKAMRGPLHAAAPTGADRRAELESGARGGATSKRTEAFESRADSLADKAAYARAPAASPPPSQRPLPQPTAQPRAPSVTAGVVDDNADFGAYLAYRERHAGAPVRERDISERYLLEVTDAHGRPVHDAEVAVQRATVAEPVMWARTDTAGRVWLHPRAFLSPAFESERVLGVAVRKGAAQARATLQRGQSQAVQLRLGAATQGAQRPRLDLVFMVDATGSMGDEITKLEASMHAMAAQIAQLPGQPDICWGLVSYRDRGDAYLTRSHDFTDDLGAFQRLLARVQAQGGGDTPEALNEALHEVVHGLSWRIDATRLVVLVADAAPHLDYGGPQYDSDMQAALAKGIKLFTVGASGLDPVGEYVFRQLAQYTAGRFVFLTYRDAAAPGSGPGTQTVHEVKNYSVQTLDRLVVRLVREELARLGRS